MRKWRRLSYSLTFLFATLLFFITSPNLKAQALPTAARTGELSAFATYSRVATDYGYPNRGGATFGLLYVREVPWLLTPSLEFRVKATFDGRTVDEHTWGGGVRFERRILDFRPYGNFFVSSGTIHYNFTNPYNPHPVGKPYTSDNSIVYSPGFGVDYNLTKYWGARFDYQFEFWNLGNNQTLTPQAMSFGILYRIRFGRETGP